MLADSQTLDGDVDIHTERRGPHIIVVGNEKGGAGKSTLAMHIAVALLRYGRRVGALDLDLRQRTFSRYVENRLRWAESRGAAAAAPQIVEIGPPQDERAFAAALAGLSRTSDFVVIDAPGADTALSRAAHASADTLVTPLNDSFVDFDVLGRVDPETMTVVAPSVYAEMVWECRKQRARAVRRPIDWIVTRTRLNPSAIESRNKHRVGEALKALSVRIGFRLAPGLGERVIYRELFPRGMTLIDLLDEQSGRELRVADIAARQELRDLFMTLKLPGLDGQPLAF